MATQMDIRRYGASPVVHQAATVPDSEPQRGPPTTTGGVTRNVRQPSTTDVNASRPENSDVPLVFAQWNAEGIRRKKPELQEFLRREKIDVICVQETHLSDAHRFSVRGYEPFRQDRPDRPKGGILTLVRNGIPAIEVGRSDTGDCEFLSVRLILPGREITTTNLYCPNDKELRLHTLPLNNQDSLILGDFNAHSPS